MSKIKSGSVISQWMSESVSQWVSRIFYIFHIKTVSKRTSYDCLILSYKRWYLFNFKLWFPTTESAQIFLIAPCVSPLRGWHCATCPTWMWARARALRNFTNSRATSKSNCDGFWPPNQLNFFVWLCVCLLYYVVDNVPCAPHARRHVDMPFYEGGP